MGILGDLITSVESGGNPEARNPYSSATGLGQFIESTWLATIAKHRPDLIEGKSPAEILAMRSDPELSKAMTEAYAADNGEILSRAGHPVTPGTQYLAHFAGPGGAVNILNADPSTPIDRVMTPAAIKANPFLAGKTAGDVVAWANKKMGAPLMVASSPPIFPPAGKSAGVGDISQGQTGSAPASYAPAAPPSLGPQASPSFAPQQAAQSQPPFSPPQLQEIQFPQRRPIKLANLPTPALRRGFY